MNKPISRRKFVQNISIAGAGMPLIMKFPTSFMKSMEHTTDPVLELKYFDFGSVVLTKSAFKDQFDRIIDFYEGLDNDSLLKPMREAAGMPAPGRDMGGWYDLGAFAPAGCFGQIMAALSRFYAVTGKNDLKDKVHQLINGFNETIRIKDGPFYKNNRFPAYIFDKQVQGLTEAFSYADAGNALDVLHRALQQALPYLPEKALTREEMRARPHKDISFTWDESYTLPENLFISYELFDEERFKKLAQRYLLNDEYFIPLSKGIPAFVHKHAYSHVNALSSAAKAYEILQDPMYYKAIAKAWEMIMQTQQYASGGWGPNETFVEPGKGLLGDSIYSTIKHFETPCGSYAHCKLGRYLIGFTADSQYGDNMEKVIYNGSLGALDPLNDGLAFYYSGYQPLAIKRRFPDPWPCCAGTLPLVVADYVRDIYFHHNDELFVNLYINSKLNWSKGNEVIAVEQQTDYPLKPGAELKITLSDPAMFDLYFRIPHWTNAKSVLIKINDEEYPFKGNTGSYYPVKREWKNGDKVNISFSLANYILPVDPQHPDLVAFMQGPLMLAGINPEIKLTTQPTLKNKNYQAGYQSGNLVFKPFYQIQNEVYTTYFKI